MFDAYYNSSCANSEEWHTVWMILGKLDTEGAINKAQYQHILVKYQQI